MKSKIYKFLAAFTIVIFLIFNNSAVIAQTVPEAPTAPSAPTQTTTTEPEAPPSPSSVPEAPSAPSSTETQPTPAPTEQPASTTESSDTTNQTENSSPVTESTAQQTAAITPTPTPSQQTQSSVTGETQNGQTGETFIKTGDAINSANVSTTGGSNTSTSEGNSGGGSAVVSGNGNASTNDALVSGAQSTETIQQNSISVGNGLDLSTNTGNNQASLNVGDSTIVTGDANTSATVVNGVNTNLAGVATSEFNIIDDHMGDFILDFVSACVSGCENLSASNTGNGAESTNSAQLNTSNSDATFQANEASVENQLVLAANSGGNQTNLNTGGDNFIKTGDANVSANVATLANNNIAGKVILGVVNIFGDLVGDILFPDEFLASLVQCSNCLSDTTASNTGNGSGTTNTASVDTTSTLNTTQTNDANIQNNLVMSTGTGGNTASLNTGGDSYVQTGTSDVQANVVNVANSNVDGGVWWLAIVNEAGQWIGKIFGAADGSNMAASEGSTFTADENGNITVTNSDNGAGSTNDANVTQSSTQNVSQSNTANVVNNLNLSAFTGGNSANQNTGGASVIKTGDAQIIANLINFVNNNVVGNGTMLVTLVNVFGSWTGDFVSPWHKKETTQTSDNTASTGIPSENMGTTSDQLVTQNSTENQTTSQDNTQQSEPATQNTQTSLGTTVARTFSYLSSAGSSNNSSGNTEVAGFKAEVLSATIELPGGSLANSDQKGKVIKLNLAWLILILPIVLIAALPKIIAITKSYLKIRRAF